MARSGEEIGGVGWGGEAGRVDRKERGDGNREGKTERGQRGGRDERGRWGGGQQGGGDREGAKMMWRRGKRRGYFTDGYDGMPERT